MPIFFQQDIDDATKLAIWKIEENEEFFLRFVPLQREITHPHKRLQHLAGRYLLQYLFPDFPISLIKIADTRKPFLENEAYHFSISHCGDYAAAIVSRTKRVGVDIEVPTPKVEKIMHKFLHDEERIMMNGELSKVSEQLVSGEGEQSLIDQFNRLTLLWSCKEAMFKWWGFGEVDFKNVLRIHGPDHRSTGKLIGTFRKEGLEISFPLHSKIFADIVLAWVVTEPDIIKIID